MTTNTTFTSSTTAAEVAGCFSSEISGKTILITGVSPNSLGEVVAHTLAAHKPRLLILAGRDARKPQGIADAIAAAHPDVKTRVLVIDLSSFASVRTAAAEVVAYPEHIDILVNNAGVMNIPMRQVSEDGFEMQLATNYLGPFLFTQGIAEKIPRGGRVVNVSSTAYMFSPFRFSDYNFENGAEVLETELPPKQVYEQYGLPWSTGYTPTTAYGQTKAAMNMWTVQLAKEWSGRDVTVVAVHPGSIATQLWRHMPKQVTDQLFKVMPMKSVEQGAAPILVAALDPKLDASSGAYLSECQIEELVEYAKDPALTKKLWDLTNQIIA